MTAPAAEPEAWDFFADGEHPPAFNMALDEALLIEAPARGRPLLRFYGWDRPAVSIGYVQRFDAAPPGFAVVRRPTGGGVVYHDHDFTYTVVIPAGHWLAGLDRVDSYGWINRAVRAGLERCGLGAELADSEIPHSVDRLTMVCFRNPTRYDILMNGVKVAGSAQRRLREGILHQGSLHFGRPLPAPRPRFAAALLEGFGAVLRVEPVAFSPSESLLEQARRLEAERYAAEAWNRRR